MTKTKLSAMMFLQFFIWGAWFVTLGGYLGTTLHFSGKEIGSAYASLAWAALVAPFFLGMIADRFFSSEKVLAVLHIIGAAVLWYASGVTAPGTLFWVLVGYGLCYMPTLALTSSIAFHHVKVGQNEFAVAAGLEGALRRRGSEWHPFPTIVASGPRSALPHARTSERVIAAGDLLLIDFGAQVDGYCSDITRTFIVGRAPDEKQRVVYEAVEEAARRAREGVRAGQTGREADALARRPLTERGFGEAFGHSLGHGLGLEVHEAPRLSPTAEAVLPEWAVVTIEPGVYLPGWGGVRIEDDVVLGADHAETLTGFPRPLTILG